MKPIQWLTLALLCGALSPPPAVAQTFDFEAPPSTMSYDSRSADDWYDQDDREDEERHYGSAPRPREDVGFFYDELSPFGDWVRTRDHGWAWFPRDVQADWRPYHDGHWVDTDYGWTWASYEPFGWATYHYGRWAWDSRFGWLWVPGTVWAPAWVSWEQGGGYVGWAPLPPEARFEEGFGLRLGSFDLSLGIRPDFYNFVPERWFLERRLARRLLPTAHNQTLLERSTNVTDYTYVRGRLINRGVDPGHVARVTGQRPERLRVAPRRSRGRSEIRDGEIRVYRPEPAELDSVRVGSRQTLARVDRGDQTPVGLRIPTEVQVAPRTEPGPPVGARENERNDRRHQLELVRHQAEQKRQLEALHREEIEATPEPRERDQVRHRNVAERKAQVQEQKGETARLTARQEAQRRAELKPPEPAKLRAPAKARGQDRLPRPPV